MPLCLPSCWVPFAGLLGSLSPLVPLFVSLHPRVACLPLFPFVSLHVGSFCWIIGLLSFYVSRVPELLVSACLPFFPSCGPPGLLVSACVPLSPFMWVPFGSRAPCLDLSPFVSLHTGCFSRLPEHLVSACLPSCGFLLNCLSPLISLGLPSCEFLLLGSCLLSPFMWFLYRVPGYLVWACLHVSPFI